MIDPDPTGPAIEIRGLSKAFGRTAVLRKLDLEVPWGHVLAILGPNGSGKTTLIKILATLTRPDEGIVRVARLDASRSGSAVRRVNGVVTHDSLLYDDLTAYENLKFSCRMFQLDRIDERIDSAAERLGLSDRLRQRVGTLSHGMRKRVSIARALLHEPRILLMDEPESGLDQEALVMLERVVSEHAESSGAVVLTTHNVEHAMAIGSRMAILARGRVVYDESLEAVDTASVRAAYSLHTGHTGAAS